MARHGFIHVCVGVDDLEESKGILVDVDAAELSDFLEAFPMKPMKLPLRSV
jgi:hypothetical protein